MPRFHPIGVNCDKSGGSEPLELLKESRWFVDIFWVGMGVEIPVFVLKVFKAVRRSIDRERTLMNFAVPCLGCECDAALVCWCDQVSDHEHALVDKEVMDVTKELLFLVGIKMVDC